MTEDRLKELLKLLPNLGDCGPITEVEGLSANPCLSFRWKMHRFAVTVDLADEVRVWEFTSYWHMTVLSLLMQIALQMADQVKKFANETLKAKE